jgi:hypothetical protein
LALFLCRLPADIQDQLVAQDRKDAATMVAVADRIYDAKPYTSGVHAVMPPPAVHAVAARSPSPASRRRSSSRQEKFRRGLDRRRDDDGQNGLCFYPTIPILAPELTAADRRAAGRETARRPMAQPARRHRLAFIFG